MEYVWTIALVIVVLPLVVLLLGRRKSGGAGIEHHANHGVTVAEPSSDQPSPSGESAVNQTAPGAERNLPPG